MAKAKTLNPYELQEVGLQSLRFGQVMPFRKDKICNAFFYSLRTKIGNIGEYTWQQPVWALRALTGLTVPAHAPAAMGHLIPSTVPCCSWPGSLEGPGSPTVPGAAAVAVPATVPPGAVGCALLARALCAGFPKAPAQPPPWSSPLSLLPDTCRPEILHVSSRPTRQVSWNSEMSMSFTAASLLCCSLNKINK